MSDNKKILVVDDDPSIITFMTALLEDNGYEVVTAVDGAQGMSQLEAEKPDLVLLDITMPEKSGVRFYREVRENEQTKDTPVIMVTGVMQEFKNFISSRRQVPPPDGYLTKPVDQALLLKTITEVLAKGN